jgi:hypothetical protein
MATRWLHRWLDENPAADIEQAAIVADLLAALGGHQHHWAYACLLDMAERATSSNSRATADQRRGPPPSEAGFGLERAELVESRTGLTPSRRAV